MNPLRAAIEWSVDQLTDSDRNLLLRLWPFEGGFTWQAAQAVAPATDEAPVLVKYRNQAAANGVHDLVELASAGEMRPSWSMRSARAELGSVWGGVFKALRC